MRMEAAAMQTLQSLIGTRPTVTIDRSFSITDAARLMSQHHIGALPVTDKGRLVGIFTERDVLTRVVAARRSPDATCVGDVMTASLIVATPDENCQACLQRMQRAHVRHLPVIAEGQLAGIVSVRDLLAAEVHEKSEALSLLNSYVHDVPLNLGTQA
jgi:CBS domain-containing protein